MPGITNTAFVAGLATILGLSGPQTVTLQDLVDDWNDGSVTRIVLANRISTILDYDEGWIAEFSLLLTGSATGGPLGDGYYPIHTPSGTTVSLPCYAKLAGLMAKGDPGSTVASLMWSMPSAKPAAGEIYGVYICDTIINLVQAKCAGYAEVGPVASKVFTLKRIRAGVTTDIATATFAIGATAPTFVITTPALAIGDIVYPVAPASQDSNLFGVSLNFSGNRA